MSCIVKIENKGPKHKLGLLLFDSDGNPNGEPEIIIGVGQSAEFTVHDGKRPYLYAKADIEIKSEGSPAKFILVPGAYATCGHEVDGTGKVIYP